MKTVTVTDRQIYAFCEKWHVETDLLAKDVVFNVLDHVEIGDREVEIMLSVITGLYEAYEAMKFMNSDITLEDALRRNL